MPRYRIIKRERRRHPNTPMMATGSVLITLECGCSKWLWACKARNQTHGYCKCKQVKVIG